MKGFIRSSQKALFSVKKPNNKSKIIFLFKNIDYACINN